jgi:hypothetical protein
VRSASCRPAAGGECSGAGGEPYAARQRSEGGAASRRGWRPALPTAREPGAALAAAAAAAREAGASSSQGLCVGELTM